MRFRSKLPLVTLATVLVLSASVSMTSAREISTTSQNFREIWTGIGFIAIGGLINVRCNLTVRGSYHYRTITKVRSLMGYITSATLTRPCTGGEAWILNGTERATNSLPWHVKYDSFTGTLPRIRIVRRRIIGWFFVIHALGNQCLYGSTAESPAAVLMNLNEATGEVNSVTADSEARIPLRETLAGSCPANGGFSGTTSTTDNGEGSRITIRLI